MTGFKTTVCASTGDNQHNFSAPTRWGFNTGEVASLKDSSETRIARKDQLSVRLNLTV